MSAPLYWSARETAGRRQRRLGALLLILLAIGYAAGGAEEAAPLTVAEAVKLAIENSAELRAARAGVDAVDATVRGARGALLPRVNVGASENYSRSPGEDPGDGGSVYLGVSQPLYDGGVGKAGVAVARARVAMAREAVDVARARIARDVRVACYDLVLEAKLVGVRTRQERLAGEHLSGVRTRRERNNAQKSEITRAEVALAEQRAALRRAEGARDVRSAALEELLGGRAGAPVAVVDAWPEVTAEAGGVDALVEAALERRPEMRASRADEELVRMRIDAARRARRPTLDVEYRLGAGWSSDSTWDEEWRVGLSFEYQVFDGNEARARVMEQSARLEEARARTAALALRVRREITTARLDLDSAVELVRSLSGNVELANQYLRDELERQRMGSNSYLDVLNARASLAAAESSYYRALRDAAVARAQLDWATGEAVE